MNGTRKVKRLNKYGYKFNGKIYRWKVARVNGEMEGNSFDIDDMFSLWFSFLSSSLSVQKIRREEKNRTAVCSICIEYGHGHGYEVVLFDILELVFLDATHCYIDDIVAAFCLLVYGYMAHKRFNLSCSIHIHIKIQLNKTYYLKHSGDQAHWIRCMHPVNWLHAVDKNMKCEVSNVNKYIENKEKKTYFFMKKKS